MASTEQFPSREAVMQRAIALAARGEGFVEPNPMVGAVLVTAELQLISKGYHREFGQAHAEVAALRGVETVPKDAILFVTLEPCNHVGKTPPCCNAVLKAGIRNDVMGSPAPAPHTIRQGIQRLRDAGVEVEVGLLQSETDALIAPFRKRITTGKPWVIAKWAMTLDGKIASRTGHSQWISSPESREIVHQIRGRVDAIVVGRGTAETDDPLLTARPPGPRVAKRVVLDRQCRLSPQSRLAQSAHEFATLLFCSESGDEGRISAVDATGIGIVSTDPGNISDVLVELGNRDCTNILVEGGSEVLGSFFDAGELDEAHVFIAPKLVGGMAAPSPFAGHGLASIPGCLSLVDGYSSRAVGPDLYVTGRLRPAVESAEAGS